MIKTSTLDSLAGGSAAGVSDIVAGIWDESEWYSTGERDERLGSVANRGAEDEFPVGFIHDYSLTRPPSARGVCMFSQAPSRGRGISGVRSRCISGELCCLVAAFSLAHVWDFPVRRLLESFQ